MHKVLYLDDEAELGEIFKDFLNSDVIEVDTFSDPKLALAAAQKKEYNIAFLDYRMPGTTGDEVAKQLPPSIKKVLITGDLAIEPSYKFDHMMQKPIDYEKVKELILEKK